MKQEKKKNIYSRSQSWLNYKICSHVQVFRALFPSLILGFLAAILFVSNESIKIFHEWVLYARPSFRDLHLQFILERLPQYNLIIPRIPEWNGRGEKYTSSHLTRISFRLSFPTSAFFPYPGFQEIFPRELRI